MIYNNIMNEITEKNAVLNYKKLFIQSESAFIANSLVSRIDYGINKRKRSAV